MNRECKHRTRCWTCILEACPFCLNGRPTDQVIADLIEKNKRLAHKDAIMASETIKDLFKELRHQKYKRCLAMEKWCHAEYDIYNLTPRTEKVEFYRRWRKRWLELAEKFKEAK